MKLNNKRGLLAVVMALAMVFAGAVFIADEADAVTTPATLTNVIGGGSVSDDVKGVQYEETQVDGVTEYTLTLDNYRGAENSYFSGHIDKIVLVGENTLTITSVMVGEFVAAIHSDVDMVVEGQGKLTITIALAEGVDESNAPYGIYTSTVGGTDRSLTIGSETETDRTKNPNITITGGNKGLNSCGDMTIQNSVVNITAMEKAIRCSNANDDQRLTITNSLVTAKATGGDNGQGMDDIYGIKAPCMTIDKMSVVTTTGIHIHNDSETTAGLQIAGTLHVKYLEIEGEFSEGWNPGIIVDDKTSYSAEETTIAEITFTDASAKLIVDGKNTITAIFKNGIIDASDDTAVEFDNVLVGNAGATVTVGSINLGGAIVSETDKITVVDGTVVLEDLVFELSEGYDANDGLSVSMDLGSKVIIKGSVTVPKGIQLNAEDIEIDKGAMLNVGGKIVATKVTNNGVIAITEDTASIPSVIQGTGSVDTGAIQEDADLGGTINSNTTFTQGQTVTLTSDTTLVNTTILTIEGTLVVPAGVMLTIKDTAALVVKGSPAKIINDGAIVIESKGQNIGYVGANQGALLAFAVYGGTGVNNGTIELVNDDDFDGNFFNGYTMYVKEAVFDNKGSIYISEYNSLGINRVSGETKTVLNNMAGAEIDVEGMIIGYVNNASSIIIDGYAWGWISLVSTDSYVDIVSLKNVVSDLTQGTAEGDHNLEINDKGLKYGKNNATTAGGSNRVVLETADNRGEEKYALESLIVKPVVKYKSSDDTYYTALDVSGSVDVETGADLSDVDENKVTMQFGGKVIVSESLDIGANVGLYNGSDLTVSGEMNIAKGRMSAQGKVTVEGKLVYTDTKLVETYLTAVHYTVKGDTVNNIPKQEVYTNLADAIGAASKEITVYGDLKVKTEITIPTDVKVEMKTGDLTVTKDGKLTVADGSKLTVIGSEDSVKGVLLVENKKNLSGTVKSDVVTTDDKTVLYSGLAYALSVATDGQTVKVSDNVVDNPVVTETDVTIPAGVTLDTNRKGLKVGQDCTLTIDGKLYLNGGALSVASADGLKAAGKVDLNGSIKSTAPMNYGIVDSKPLPGAYFTMLEDGILYNYVEPVALAAPKAASVYEQAISIVGIEDLGDVSFAGTSDDPVTVTVTGALKSGKFTIDYGTVALADGTHSVTIASADGTVALVKAVTVGFAAVSGDVSDEKVFYITGKTTGNNDDLAKKVETNVVIGGTVALVKADLAYATVDGDAVVIGGAENASSIGYLNVTGTLTVDNATVLNVVKNAYVSGTLATAEKTDTEIAGKVVVKEVLYVGFDWTTPVAKPVTEGTATVTDGVATEKVMYVLAGASVPADMVEDMVAVEFYVDDKLYMTAYAVDANQALAGLPAIDSEEYFFDGWMDGKAAVTTATTIGEIKDDVEAEIVYDVYVVKFVISEGIDDVYLDGVLVGDLSSGIRIDAGAHTVSYTLANGYTGTAKMLVNGTEVSGYTFTASGKYTNDADETGSLKADYTVTLQGIEKAPAETAPVVEEDDGLALTDILLIVLVVLIVIMAVIVALRMMRS